MEKIKGKGQLKFLHTHMLLFQGYVISYIFSILSKSHIENRTKVIFISSYFLGEILIFTVENDPVN